MTTSKQGDRMAGFAPAEVFPPGVLILEELQERGWTQTDLAEVMGRPVKTISEIVNAKVRVTEETARELELALGIDAEFWLRTEAYYRLHTTPTPASISIARRAEIRRRVPLRQMIARGWIVSSDNTEELTRNVEAYLGVPLSQRVPFVMAAKQVSYDQPLSPVQEVWLIRARRLADTMIVAAY